MDWLKLYADIFQRRVEICILKEQNLIYIDKYDTLYIHVENLQYAYTYIYINLEVFYPPLHI